MLERGDNIVLPPTLRPTGRGAARIGALGIRALIYVEQ